jgi:hypothetical protein
VESKFRHLEAAYLEGLGVAIAPSAKMPDLVVHDTKRNGLVLIETARNASLASVESLIKLPSNAGVGFNSKFRP